MNTKSSEAENKISDVSGLVTTLSNTKTGEVENKIPDITSLNKKAYYNTKIKDMEGKYFTKCNYKFMSDILDSRIKKKKKKKKKTNKCDIPNLVRNSDLNSKLPTLATESELKAEQYKIGKSQTHDLSYFLGKNFFRDDGLENMFVYQPTLDILELKKARTLIMFLDGNQMGSILLNVHHYKLVSCIA